jgi:hypothetical protein
MEISAFCLKKVLFPAACVKQQHKNETQKVQKKKEKKGVRGLSYQTTTVIVKTVTTGATG